MNTTATDLATLRAALPGLNERDRAFAADLLAKSARGLSEKQMFWVRKLAAPATAPAIIETADLTPIVALFAKANGKRSKITFEGFRLTVAGPASRAPGSINVTSTEGDYEGRTWFGRITTAGQFQPSPRAGDTAPVAAALACFAADPAGQAAAYGHRTGSCAFCSKELTDSVSVGLGYGPRCARKWGLPHNKAALVAA